MKKLLLILLTALLLTAFALAEEAEEPAPPTYTSGDWRYILLEDATAEIVRYTGDAEELTIPAELDGYAVTSIGDDAFSWCTSLKSITLPDTVTNIGNLAFYQCTFLTSIILPDSVTSIGENPFAYCKELTTIIVSPGHPTLATIDGVLFDKVEKRLICYPYTHTASSYAVPQGIRSIGNSAFYWCSSLTSITLPDTLTSIGDSAFVWCSSLTSITLPDTLKSLGDGAFVSCISLTSIALPESLTSIGVNPFTNCSELTDIIVSPKHPTLATINGVLFEKTEKRLVCYPHAYTADSYTVPQGIRVIGDSAFSYCTTLTSITLPETVTSIGDEAFYFCTTLTNITLPDNLTSIGEEAFSLCPSLTLTIPRDTWLTDWCKDAGVPYTYPDSLDWLLE